MLYVNSYAIDNKVWFYTVSGALSRQIKLVLLRAGVGNWRPGGHMRPPPSLNAALRLIPQHRYTVALVSAQTGGKGDPL